MKCSIYRCKGAASNGFDLCYPCQKKAIAAWPGPSTRDVRRPLTATSAARLLARKCIEYTGVPDGKGGYTRPTDEMLDSDIGLYALARETLRLLNQRRKS